MPPSQSSRTRRFSRARFTAFFAAITALLFVGAINHARAQFTFASDNASNYGGSWNNGNNGGTGFNAWSFNNGANAGEFIGSPANNGMGTTGIGTTAFGVYGNQNGQYYNATRSLSTGMGIGDSLTFWWAMNWDTGAAGLNKGIEFRTGSSNVFSINNSGTSSDITVNGVNTTFGYGTTPMLVTITRTSATQYSFSMSPDRDGTGSYSATISSSATIDGFNIYGSNNDNNGNRNVYYNNFANTNSGVFSQGGSVTNANRFTGSGALSIGNNTTLVLSGGGNNDYTGATTISNGSTLVFAGSGTSQFASTIGGGTGNLVMSNASGTVILTNNNTYTGNTTVAAGTLLIGHASALGSTGTLSVNTGGRLQLSNNITFTRAITLNGDGVSSSGALQNISGNNTWSGDISNNSGARINSSAGLLTISGNVTNAASQTLYIGGAGNTTLSGSLTGTLATGNGALFKDDAGTLTLNANNSGLTGLVRLRGGTISITNGNSLGSGSLELGTGGTTATLLVNSNTTIANRLEIADGISAGVINVASGQTATMTGILSQTNGTTNTTKFGKDGAGVLVFNNGSGTYNGQIQIGQGTVIVGATGALGTNTSTSARGIDLGLNVGDTSQANNVALLASNGVTVGQSIYVDANTGGATRTIGLSGSGTNTYSNEIYLGGTLTVDAGTAATDQVNISGAINNTGGLTKTGAGVLLLSGNNGYTGATTISAGTLRIGANDRISSQSSISIASGATLDLNNFSDNLGPISGSGSITLGSSGALSVTVGAGTNSTFSGQISGGGSFTKAGDGQQNLSGSNNFSGVTTVSAGMLELQNANALGNATGNTVVSSGAALKLYSGTGISYAAEALTLSGVGIGGADGALRNVGGTNIWNGAITLSGNSRINADNTSGSPASSLTLAGDITGGANVLFLGANGGNLTISGALSGAGNSQDATTTSIFKDGANNLTLSGNNTYSGDTRLVGGSLTVAAGGTLGNGDSDVFISSGATLNVNTNVTVDSVRETTNNNGGVVAIAAGATLTVDGANKGTFYQNNISGAGGLTMAGSGNTLLGLYGTQSYTGTTTVSGGKLSSGVALATTNVTVTGGEFETTSTNVLASTASVIVNGGIFTLGGNNTIGALSGTGGTMALGTNNLTTSTSANTSFAGALTGSGAFVKQGTGSLTLSGANTASGGLYIDNGAVALNGGSVGFSIIEIGGGFNGGAQPGNAATLQVSSGSFSTPITVNAETNSSGTAGNRIINFANASGSATLSGNVTAEKTFIANVDQAGATGVLSGIISGAGGLTKTGDGTLTLSGSANTYTNLTTVSAGTLNLNKTGGNAIQGDVLVSSGATLLLSASDQVASSGSPMQTVTLSGGTITRASGVSETFGALVLTAKSFINYTGGTGAALTFRDINYTPSALLVLELVNFTQGNSLVIQDTADLTSAMTSSFFTSTGSGGIGSYFYTPGSNANNGTFTITAIPEPSTYVAAAGLLALFLWPARRRVLKDVKSVLGLRPTGRDRVEAYRQA